MDLLVVQEPVFTTFIKLDAKRGRGRVQLPYPVWKILLQLLYLIDLTVKRYDVDPCSCSHVTS